jgi:hypothetical protein
MAFATLAFMSGALHACMREPGNAMRKTVQAASCLCALLAALTACSSGGGGGASGPPAGSPSTPAVPPPSASTPSFTVPAALAPGTGGNAPNLASDATLSLQPNPPVGAEFTLLHTALTIGGTAVESINAGRGTVGVESVGADGIARLRLKLPDLGIDASGLTFSVSGETATNGTTTAVLAMERKTYMSFGKWDLNPASGSSTGFTEGAAVMGYQTPATAVPTTGAATYAGADGVRGIVTAPVVNMGTSQVAWAFLSGGRVTLDVDFAAGTLNGLLDGIMLSDARGMRGWNQVQLSGTLAGGTFSGTTASDSPADISDPMVLGPATGSFSGAFYGPAAQEAGGVWTLAPADGRGSAIGSFGAAKR